MPRTRCEPHVTISRWLLSLLFCLPINFKFLLLHKPATAAYMRARLRRRERCAGRRQAAASCFGHRRRERCEDSGGQRRQSSVAGAEIAARAVAAGRAALLGRQRQDRFEGGGAAAVLGRQRQDRCEGGNRPPQQSSVAGAEIAARAVAGRCGIPWSPPTRRRLNRCDGGAAAAVLGRRSRDRCKGRGVPRRQSSVADAETALRAT